MIRTKISTNYTRSLLTLVLVLPYVRSIVRIEVIISDHVDKVIPIVVSSYPTRRAIMREELSRGMRYIFTERYEYRSQDMGKWYFDAQQGIFNNTNVL